MMTHLQVRTQHCLKHHRVPKSDRDDTEPPLHEPRVFAQEDNRNETTQWEDAKEEVDHFVLARSVDEPAVVSDMRSSGKGR